MIVPPQVLGFKIIQLQAPRSPRVTEKRKGRKRGPVGDQTVILSTFVGIPLPDAKAVRSEFLTLATPIHESIKAEIKAVDYMKTKIYLFVELIMRD